MSSDSWTVVKSKSYIVDQPLTDNAPEDELVQETTQDADMNFNKNADSKAASMRKAPEYTLAQDGADDGVVTLVVHGSVKALMQCSSRAARAHTWKTAPEEADTQEMTHNLEMMFSKLTFQEDTATELQDHVAKTQDVPADAVEAEIQDGKLALQKRTVIEHESTQDKPAKKKQRKVWEKCANPTCNFTCSNYNQSKWLHCQVTFFCFLIIANYGENSLF